MGRACNFGALNQVQLVIQMHPTRYLTQASRVGLVGTLLSNSALSWFAPLLSRTRLNTKGERERV